jgi:hypothetical protein
MQSQLVVGDSLNILSTFTDFPPADGWTLKTRFLPLSPTGTAIILNAVAEGDSYRTTASSNTTAAWEPGDYSVSQWVEKVGQRITAANGSIKLLPNPATATAGTDTRSHLEKVIANIEAMLENKAGKDVQEFTIGDRSLKKMTVAELIKWRDKYKFELARQQNSGKTGKQFGRKILTRM